MIAEFKICPLERHKEPATPERSTSP